MKKIYFLLFVIIFSAGPLSAQQTALSVSFDGADSLIVSADKKVSTFMGNVTLQSEKLQIFKAEKILFNKELHQIIAFGYKEFSFDGQVIIVPSQNGKHSRIEYTLGENVAYIK